MGSFLDDVLGVESGGGTPLQNVLGLPEAGSVVNGLTGQTGAEASLAGAQMQYAASKEAREQMERLNRPYLQLGQKALPFLNRMIEDPTGANFLKNNPLFNRAVNYSGDQIKNVAAAQGKAGSGGTVQQLFNNYMATGDQFVNSAFNRLLQPVTIGQNAANFQGANTAGS